MCFNRSSSAASTKATETITSISDAGDVDSDSQKISVAGGGDVSVTVSDENALDLAENVVLESLDHISENNSLNAAMTSGAIEKSVKLAEFAATSEAGKVTQDLLSKGLFIVAGLGAVYMITKKGKK